MKDFKKKFILICLTLFSLFATSCRIFPQEFGADKMIIIKWGYYIVLFGAARVFVALIFFSIAASDVKNHLGPFKYYFPAYLVLLAAAYDFFHSNYENFTIIYLVQMIMFDLFCLISGICKKDVKKIWKFIEMIVSFVLIFNPLQWYLHTLKGEETVLSSIGNFLNSGINKIGQVLKVKEKLFEFMDKDFSDETIALICFIFLLVLIWITLSIICWIINHSLLGSISKSQILRQNNETKKIAREQKLEAERQQKEAEENERKRQEEEARIAEEKRKAEEVRKAEEAKKAEEARIAEEKQREEEARIAEEKRKAEEARKVEEAKKAEEARIVEEKLKAEEFAKRKLEIENILPAKEDEFKKLEEKIAAYPEKPKPMELMQKAKDEKMLKELKTEIQNLKEELTAGEILYGKSQGDNVQ